MTILGLEATGGRMMNLEIFKDVDMRELALYIKRRCFSNSCKDCELLEVNGRCFFDSQTLLYEGEKPNGDLYKSVKLLHPCHWDFAGLSEEGWDGDTIRMGNAKSR